MAARPSPEELPPPTETVRKRERRKRNKAGQLVFMRPIDMLLLRIQSRNCLGVSC